MTGPPPCSRCLALQGTAGERIHSAKANELGRAQFVRLLADLKEHRDDSPGHQPVDARMQGELDRLSLVALPDLPQPKQRAVAPRVRVPRIAAWPVAFVAGGVVFLFLLRWQLPAWVYAAFGAGAVVLTLLGRRRLRKSEFATATLTRSLDYSAPFTAAAFVWVLVEVLVRRAPSDLSPEAVASLAAGVRWFASVLAEQKPTKGFQLLFMVVVAIALSLLDAWRVARKKARTTDAEKDAGIKVAKVFWQTLRVTASFVFGLAAFGLVGKVALEDSTEFSVLLRKEEPDRGLVGAESPTTAARPRASPAAHADDRRLTVLNREGLARAFIRAEVISVLLESGDLPGLAASISASQQFVAEGEWPEARASAESMVFGSPARPGERPAFVAFGARLPAPPSAPPLLPAPSPASMEEAQAQEHLQRLTREQLDEELAQLDKRLAEQKRRWPSAMQEVLDKAVDLAVQSGLKPVLAPLFHELGGDVRVQLVKLVVDFALQYPMKELVRGWMVELLDGPMTETRLDASRAEIRTRIDEGYAQAAQKLRAEAKAVEREAKAAKARVEAARREESERVVRAIKAAVPKVEVYGKPGCWFATRFERAAKQAGASVERKDFTPTPHDANYQEFQRHSDFAVTGCPLADGDERPSILVKVNGEPVRLELEEVGPHVRRALDSALRKAGVSERDLRLQQHWPKLTP